MSRNLTFYYKPGGLTKPVNIFFTFPPPTGSVLKDPESLVAWKTVQLQPIQSSTTTGNFAVDYSNRFGFGTAQINRHDVISPGLVIEITPGHSTTLTLVRSEPVWSQPTDIRGDSMQAINGTDSYQNITFGTVTEDKYDITTLSPTYVWKVGSGGNATADFNSQLQMYVIPGWDKNLNLDKHPNLGKTEFALIKIDMNATLVWHADLPSLPESTDWIFTETNQGAYKITRKDD